MRIIITKEIIENAQNVILLMREGILSKKEVREMLGLEEKKEEKKD